LCGCETWSLILTEEYKLKILEKRLLWGVFYRNREEMTEDWRKLHNEDFIVFTTLQTTMCDCIEEI